MRAVDTQARRANFWWAGGAILVSAPVDFFFGTPNPSPDRSLLACTVLRLALAGVLWSVALYWNRMTPRRRRAASLWSGFVAGNLYLALAALSGGARSSCFEWTLAIPLILVLLIGDSLWLVVPSALINVAAAGWMERSAHAGSSAILGAVIERAATGGIALFAALFHQRLTRMLVHLTTELSDREARMLHTEQLAFIGQLAAGVAHEIRNPLSFVMNNVEFVRDELRSGIDPPILSALDDMLLGTQRINQIVTDLRALARQEDAKEGGCEIGSVVEEAVRFAGPRLDGIHVERTVGPLPLADIPRHRLVQILVNLLVNAADALGAREGAKVIAVRATQLADGAVGIEVSDNGPGFAPHQIDRLFTPFYTTKPPGQGTGLGLALSHAYLRRFGGSIVAENHARGGALLRLTVKAEQPKMRLAS